MPSRSLSSMLRQWYKSNNNNRRTAKTFDSIATFPLSGDRREASSASFLVNKLDATASSGTRRTSLYWVVKWSPVVAECNWRGCLISAIHPLFGVNHLCNQQAALLIVMPHFDHVVASNVLHGRTECIIANAGDYDLWWWWCMLVVLHYGDRLLMMIMRDTQRRIVAEE